MAALATHGYYRRGKEAYPLSPMLRSGIVFADGDLTAEEVSSLDLRGCELAALSACETGTGTRAGRRRPRRAARLPTLAERGRCCRASGA